ncbi:MAG: acylneuraminate cytidylyltransferase, partial [Spirochaetaceae bacterium]|nr:acylneuraminate cytidylyltransferase [Spirochaetaceae bacterium]
MTGDNPFLFYEAASATISRFSELKCDYFTYSGLPHGSGVEIFDAHSLLKAEKLTQDPYDHEHVGPALYNHKDVFNAVFEQAPEQWFYPQLRTTIDTAEDYRRAQFIAENVESPAESEKIIQFAEKSQKKVLLVPSVKKGHGTGHLRRCISLMKGVLSDLYIPENADLPGLEELLKDVPDYALKKDFESIKEGYSLIVTDVFSLEKDEIRRFA